MSLTAQRRAKRLMVESHLQRHCSLEPGRIELLGADLGGVHYRNRLVLQIDAAGTVGFFQTGTRSVVDVAECLIARPLLNSALQRLRPLVRKLAGTAERLLIRETAFGLHGVLGLRGNGRLAPQLTAEFKQIIARFEVSGGAGAVRGSQTSALAGFAQVNSEANEILCRAVREAVHSPRALELYAGAGNFSIPLAQSGVGVTAVELNADLVRLGRRLAAEQGAAVDFVEADCERYLRERSPGEPCGTVVMDPPRRGAKGVAVLLSPRVIDRIVYVSCSLPTLGRDLNLLAAAGFEFERAAVIDMFPHTHHVEVVAVLNGRPPVAAGG